MRYLILGAFDYPTKIEPASEAANARLGVGRDYCASLYSRQHNLRLGHQRLDNLSPTAGGLNDLTEFIRVVDL